MANEWSGNLIVLSSFVDTWLDYEEGAGVPIANNQAVVIACCSQDLVALDANDADLLIYRITSLPDEGFAKLYDPNGYLVEPNFAHPNSIAITSVPFILTSKYVICAVETDALGMDSFTWDCNDNVEPPCGGVSNTATVSILTGPPKAFDSNEVCYVDIKHFIPLTAIDDGEPCGLSYYIASLPSDGDLLFTDNIDDVIASVPFLINNAYLWYIADSDANSSFTWYANDGDANSNIATVALYNNPHPVDRVCFSDGGYIVIANSNNLDFSEPNNGFAFFLRTRQKNANLLWKRDGGSGYEVLIVGGKVRVNLYDANGLSVSLWSANRVDDARWYHIGVHSFISNPLLEDCVFALLLSGCDEYGNVNQYMESQYAQTATFDYSNDVNLFIASNIISNKYKGEIDRLRFYKSADSLSLAAACLEDRQEVGNGLFAADPILRWMCDEGEGEILIDDKQSKPASLVVPCWQSRASEEIQNVKSWRKLR